MGWTGMAMPGEGARGYLDKRVYSGSDDQSTHTVIDSSLVGGREYYAAVETIGRATGERHVFAGVALVRISKSSGEEFGYKGMSEEMGPYYYNCPLRILDKLTPTENAIALAWRTKCRETAALRSIAAKGPKLAAGQRVQFAVPIRFNDGAELSVFDVQKQLFGNALVFVDPGTRSRYRITGARSREHAIISASPNLEGTIEN